MMSVSLGRTRLDRARSHLISLVPGNLGGVAGAHFLSESIQQVGLDWHLSALLMAGFVLFFLHRESAIPLSRDAPHNHHDGSHAHHRKAGQLVSAELVAGGASYTLACLVMASLINGH